MHLRHLKTFVIASGLSSYFNLSFLILLSIRSFQISGKISYDDKSHILSEYNNSLKPIKGISFLPKIKWGESACWMSGIFLDLKVYSDIAKISCFLKERNIDARPFWKPINKQLPYKNALSTDCPVSEDTAKRFLALPCATNLNKKSQKFVISSLIDVLSNNNF